MKHAKSNIPEQFGAWTGKNGVAKMLQLARLDKAMQFSPGTPCVYLNRPATVISASGKTRMLRLEDGRMIAADLGDLKPIAKPFSDPAEDDDDDES